jgi:hypothetical protein
MARDKDQAQEIVADLVIKQGVEVRLCGLLLGRKLARKLLMLALLQFMVSEVVDGAALADRHEPGAGPVGNAGIGPLLKGGDKSVMRELLGDAYVAHEPRKPSNELCLLKSKNCLDCAMCVGRRHDDRTHHFAS